MKSQGMFITVSFSHTVSFSTALKNRLRELNWRGYSVTFPDNKRRIGFHSIGIGSTVKKPYKIPNNSSDLNWAMGLSAGRHPVTFVDNGCFYIEVQS